MRALNDFSKVIDEFADRADFIIIYLSEAHPIDGKRPNENIRITQHKNLEDRLDAANFLHSRIVQDFGEKKAEQMPIFLDSMKNVLNETFLAFPERLIVLENNYVTFIGSPGPFFCNVAELNNFLDSRFFKTK